MQACPHDSVEFRLRPPGIELWTSHKPMAAELALQFTLLGAGMPPHLGVIVCYFKTACPKSYARQPRSLSSAVKKNETISKKGT